MLHTKKENMDLCKQLTGYLLLYSKRIIPVYNYLIAIKGQKPLQVLIEIENIFAHMAQACRSRNTDNNLLRAKTHLTRLEIDTYKLLLVEIKLLLEKELHMSKEFITLSRKAREIELDEIGSNDNEKVRLSYKNAIDYGLAKLKLEPLKIEDI